MSSKIKSFAQLQAMSPAELLTFHQTDNEPGDFYRLEYGDLLAKALEKALAATPAPASDEVLAELEALLAKATAGPWQAEDNAVIQERTSPVVVRYITVPDDEAPCLASDARLIAALRNAAPALLARVRQAEAFKAQVLEVLTTRREAAHALFLEDLEETQGEGPTAGAEAGDEISKIAQALGLVLGETVKGGQPC